MGNSFIQAYTVAHLRGFKRQYTEMFRGLGWQNMAFFQWPNAVSFSTALESATSASLRGLLGLETLSMLIPIVAPAGDDASLSTSCSVGLGTPTADGWRCFLNSRSYKTPATDSCIPTE